MCTSPAPPAKPISNCKENSVKHRSAVRSVPTVFSLPLRLCLSPLCTSLVESLLKPGNFETQPVCAILTCPMPDDSPLQQQTPDSLMLFGFWYRALPAIKVEARRNAPSHAARAAASHRPRPARPSLRPARRLPPPRHAPLLRTLRRRANRMLLPRLAVRRPHRPVHTRSHRWSPIRN